jgi:lipopolysaccharide transport system permease protein
LLRDIQAEYRDSFLGIIWALVPPALTAAGFAFASNSGVLNVDRAGLPIPYPAYVMLGTMLWQTFVEAFNGPQLAMQSSRFLLLQVKFPYEAIVWSQLGQTLFNLIIKLVIALTLLILIFRIPFSWTAIFAPLSILSLVFLGTAIGLFLLPITNLVQDVSRSLQFVIMGLFFITPIAYPIPPQGILSTVMKINPLTPLLVTTMEFLTTGHLSSPLAFSIVSLISLVGLLTGWIIFRLSIPFIAERIS